MTTPAAEYTPTHEVILDAADGTPYPTELVCNAGPEGPCRAVWTCDCEAYYDASIRNGVPAHRPNLEDDDTWHAGRFDLDLCGLREWFSDESLSGKIRIPVKADFGGDYVMFEMLNPTATTIRQAKAEALRDAAGEVEVLRARQALVTQHQQGKEDGLNRAAETLRALSDHASRIEAGE